jgi:BolA protein
VSAETIARLRERLDTLAPLAVEIEDDSHRHAGHAGARGGGGHYNLRIVSAAFAGRKTVARHRLIYEAAGDLMRGPVHALSIRAFAPDEV